MLTELNQFKVFLMRGKALEKEKQEFLSRTIFTNFIMLQKIPRDEKALAKTIKNALILNKSKYPWISLTIKDSFLENIYIFGREKDIICNLERIVKMVILRQECMIGYTSVSLTPGKFGLKNFF